MISVLQMIKQLEERSLKAQETALDRQKQAISSENNVHNNILVSLGLTIHLVSQFALSCDHLIFYKGIRVYDITCS